MERRLRWTEIKKAEARFLRLPRAIFSCADLRPSPAASHKGSRVEPASDAPATMPRRIFHVSTDCERPAVA